ncbi:putative ATP-dependent RNA helicase DDX20 [Aulostomus maculatus]
MAACVRRAAHDVETRTRTEDVLLSDGIDFGSLLLSPAVRAGLSAAGFQRPSPIQLKAIPLGRCGLDLIVQAKSGTGKTCVFCTIALDSLVLENSATQVLVLAPTREIAVQIHSVVMAVGCAMEGLQCHVFIGGRPVSQDKLHLKKCHIAVGSPGRIKQLIELGVLSTASVRLFVLDEADKLLEEGSFQEQINWIFSSLPENKQMLALSATYPESLAQHLTRYMREPTFVRLNPRDMGLKGLKQYYKLVPSHPLPHRLFEEKVQHLLELFSKIPFNQALVFSNLHTRAQHLSDILTSKGLPAVCISGGLSQDQRLEAMSKLKTYQCRVLISTDLTSRGIDAEKVNLVVNLDVPQDWETYMHRIGRAGRFGTQGLAVTYCCHGEEENKMMAIAQKCGLSLSALPATVEAGLMDEPCDWGVCSEASAPGLPSQLLPRKQRNRNTKLDLPAAPPAPASPRAPSQAFPDSRPPPPGPSEAGPTRKELQDALPKIPPLSSFKTFSSGLLSFQEAEQDFQVFITTGLGRSVQVIREFRGQDDGGDHHGGTREIVTLDDDGAQNVSQWKCELLPPKPAPGPPSSWAGVETRWGDGSLGAERGGAEHREVADLRNTGAPKSSAAKIRQQTTCAAGGRAAGGDMARTATPPTVTRAMREETKKRCENFPEKVRRRRRRDEEHAEEEEGGAESYWRACYRAWSEHYASMAPPQHHGYHGYYSTARNWMAAYRMNAVYVEELMRD